MFAADVAFLTQNYDKAATYQMIGAENSSIYAGC